MPLSCLLRSCQRAAVIIAAVLLFTSSGMAVTQITYLGRGNDPERQVYERLIREFMNSNPDVDVRMELMGDGWYQARLTLAVDRPQEVRQVRLMLHPGNLDREDLQVGHVWMRGLREEPVSR